MFFDQLALYPIGVFGFTLFLILHLTVHFCFLNYSTFTDFTPAAALSLRFKRPLVAQSIKYQMQQSLKLKVKLKLKLLMIFNVIVIII